jgi:hypothetical protein
MFLQLLHTLNLLLEFLKTRIKEQHDCMISKQAEDTYSSSIASRRTFAPAATHTDWMPTVPLLDAKVPVA